MNPTKLTMEDVRNVLSAVTYKNWAFESGPMSHGFFLRVRIFEWDQSSGVAQMRGMTGRKWYVSGYATKSEIVQTALKAVLTAEEHEAREAFRFRGLRVFGPHIDIDKLCEVALSTDARKEPA